MYHTGTLAQRDHTTVAALTWVGGFLSGITIQTFHPGDLFQIFILALSVLFGFILWRVVWRHHLFLLVLILLFGVSCGLIRYETATWNIIHPLLEARLEEKVTVEGVIIREVVERATTAQLILETRTINGIFLEHPIMVITERFPRFHYGDHITVSGILELPETFETEFDRTFDYPGYLRARDIRYTLPFAKVERIGAGEGNPLMAFLLRMKRAFMDNIEQALPEPSAGIAEGITLGVKRALGDTLETAFRTTGIIHIVVLSGYNVTIVAEGIMRLLRAFTLPRTRMVVGIIAIVTFAIIAGLSPTVTRATIMAGLILFARTTGNAYTTMRALIFAGVIMLLINPHLLINDPGFQLSFIATAGLILFAPILEQWLVRVPTTLQIREFLTATIATQIFVLPLLLFSIGEFSLVAIAVNVLVLPAVPLAMFGTFITGVIGAVSTFLAFIPAYITHLLLVYLAGVVRFFADLPFSSVIVPAFPFWVVFLGYLLLAGYLYTQHVRASVQKRQ